ncbi:MAG: uracil-DNA glycosylase [Bryobacterales bacterium]|nr:uracil-DNA glycosylase [Bryobacterales bacterium]
MKRRAYRDWNYWGKPVPSFGDPMAKLLIIGLAPGAHGANRTGRMFTGDSSGDFLYRTLYETGFASRPVSTHRGDGLELRDAYITAAARCAPPGNKPTREEFEACRPYLVEELQLLSRVQVVIALGRLALDSYLTILQGQGRIEKRSVYPFGHAVKHCLPGSLPVLLCSYHPSRQNTQTGRLTPSMFLQVFRSARRLLR